MSPAFRRVLAEAQRWGVDVLLFGSTSRITSTRGPCPGKMRVDHHAPASLAGIRWPERSVWWADSTDDNDALDLSHEVLHCVVGTNPDVTEEIEGPMLALEAATAKRLKLPGFDEYLAVFGTPNGGEWGVLNKEERRGFLRASRRMAEEAGLMKNGRPTYKLAPIVGSEAP